MESKRSLRGPRVVLGMFLFASLISSGLWIYFELHTRPFRELTDQLGETFPHSSPRVEGGKAGLHKQTARVLRIVMRISYNPYEDEQRFLKQQSEILSIASQKKRLNQYDECEIHLFYQPAELKAQVRSVTIERSGFPL